MPPIKTNIRTQIETSILAMGVAGGYNFEWDSNNRDLALAQFPNFYVKFVTETNLDFTEAETNAQAYINEVDVEIVVWTKNASSGYDPQRIGEEELDKAEDDLKKLFGNSGQQGSPLGSVGADSFQYMGSETSYFESNDVFTPSKRILNFRLQYAQDRLSPEQTACI